MQGQKPKGLAAVTGLLWSPRGFVHQPAVPSLSLRLTPSSVPVGGCAAVWNQPSEIKYQVYINLARVARSLPCVSREKDQRENEIWKFEVKDDREMGKKSIIRDDNKRRK